MKISNRWVLVLAALLLSSSAVRASVTLAVTVHGSRRFQATNSHGKAVIASQAVTNATICADFGVSPKDYAVVYNTSGVLYLYPRKAGGGAPTTIFSAQASYESYASDSPKGILTFAPLVSSADADATAFGGMKGVMTVKISQSAAGVKGAMGSVHGAATMNAPFYLYSISFDGTKFFQQTP
ncbi:MAG: hypothetical protein QOD99_1877 [Chthoniobacter sp.]|jgi:hypothetical protein|nr:hypothetical protein [Chthoniobacter sp.]